MGEKAREVLKLQFDKRLRLEFHGARITSDAGLLACRELDGALGLTEVAPAYLRETRGGRSMQHKLVPLLWQSVYSRLAGYEDTNTLSRFETEALVTEENLRGLGQMNAEWVGHAMA